MKIKLSTPLCAAELHRIYGKRSDLPDERRYTHVATHSAECDPETLFFALDGERVCGDRFIPALASEGITCIGRVTACGCYTVASGTEALLSLGKYYKKEHLPALQSTVGITGSVGKTTTKEAVARMLGTHYRVHKTEGNRNSEIGLPLTILEAPPTTEILVPEMGINHPGEMERMARCAAVDLAVITNIGTAHIGNFGSREAIANEKSRIRQAASVPIVTDAEPLLSHLPNILAVGESGRYRLQRNSTNPEHILYRSDQRKLPIPYSMPPADIAAALLYSLAIGELLSLSASEMEEGVRAILAYDGRRQIFDIHGIRVIDDSYNASLESMALSLSLLSAYEGGTFAVLADMLELGTHSEPLHRALGKEIAKANPTRVYYLGEYSESVRHGATTGGYDARHILPFPPYAYEECVEQILSDVHEGDTLLLKGAHKSELFRIREILRAKKNQ